MNDIVSEVKKKLPLDDLLEALYSLTRFLSQSKRKNVHLNKLVGILEEKLENITPSDKLHDLVLENNWLSEQVDTLRIVIYKFTISSKSLKIIIEN